MAVKRHYRLNLAIYGSVPAVVLSQYDEGYDVEFELRDGDSAVTGLSSYTFTLRGTRYDGLAYEFTGTLTNNVVTFEIDTTMTGVAGKGTAEISITDSNDTVYGTYNVDVIIEPSPVPDGAVDADVTRAESAAEVVQEIVDTAEATIMGLLPSLSYDSETKTVTLTMGGAS